MLHPKVHYIRLYGLPTLSNDKLIGDGHLTGRAITLRKEPDIKHPLTMGLVHVSSALHLLPTHALDLGFFQQHGPLPLLPSLRTSLSRSRGPDVYQHHATPYCLLVHPKHHQAGPDAPILAHLGSHIPRALANITTSSSPSRIPWTSAKS